jgi:hypothetical protein
MLPCATAEQEEIVEAMVVMEATVVDIMVVVLVMKAEGVLVVVMVTVVNKNPLRTSSVSFVVRKVTPFSGVGKDLIATIMVKKNLSTRQQLPMELIQRGMLILLQPIMSLVNWKN